MRLIDADAMREEWLENGENEYVYDTNAILDSIDAQPTIETVEVVHGKWKIKYGSEGDVYWYCSKCRHEVLFDIHGYQEKTDFCPYCGARMDGAE